MKKILDKILFVVTTYFYGAVSGIILHFLRKLGIISVKHWDRFPRWQKKMILVSNHPSLLEALFLPALFFPEYIFYPHKLGPWSTPDKKNYWDKWYYFWVRPRAIPIERGNNGAELRALIIMKNTLLAGERIILFPEGGRTSTGEKRGETLLCSQKGNKIRQLKTSIGWLSLKTGAMVVPVWLEGTDKVLPNGRLPFPRFWRKITIKIGESMTFPKGDSLTKETVTANIAAALLNLADEE